MRKLRAIARVLNSLIIHKNLEEIDEKVREVLSTALVDVGGAVECGGDKSCNRDFRPGRSY